LEFHRGIIAAGGREVKKARHMVGDLTPPRSSSTLSLRKERVGIVRKRQQLAVIRPLLFFSDPLLNKERVDEERGGVRSPTPK